MGKPAGIGAIVVLSAVVLIIAVRLFSAGTTYDFQISNEETSTATFSENASAPQGGETAKKTLYVHVVGAVNNPGLYELDDGARVAAAITAAGGFTEDAASESVNLARELSDGEQVMVSIRSDNGQVCNPATQLTMEAGAANTSGLVNINLADAQELTSLPGIGESTALKIVTDRQANGPFDAIEDLKRVSGIGDKKFEALRELICV